jgi:alkaline phosphatase D
MTVNRRAALALLGLGGGAAAAPALGREASTKPGVSFAHGVAAGDPLRDRAIIWTRLTPADPATRSLHYSWSVAPVDRRPGGAKGVGVTDASRDFTVKVDVKGLDPDRAYIYSFKAGGVGSPVGRFMTLPVGKTDDVVMAVATCSLYPGGYFNAYQAIAELPRVDVVLHLGDYIYEYALEGYGAQTGKALNRIPTPDHECVTLADYRLRHACHKADPQLQAAHARAAWIVVWDDHETANDSWTGGAENHQPATEGDWNTRKAAGIKAYYEWMPIREPDPAQPFICYRSFHFGDLAALIMTETRLTARTQQLTYAKDFHVVDGNPDVAGFEARWQDPGRRMMGPGQEDWIAGELAASVTAGHAWQVLGNQVVMADIPAPDVKSKVAPAQWSAALAGIDPEDAAMVEGMSLLAVLGLPYNLDSWDGYPADRARLYKRFRDAKANPIVLSGDSHAFWANELHDDRGLLAVEFGATGITSPGNGDALPGLPLNEGFEAAREVVFCDHSAKGFVLLTLTRDAAKGELIAVSTIMDRRFETTVLKAFTVQPLAGGGVGPLKAV